MSEVDQLKERVRFLENKLKVVMGLIGRLDSRLDHADEKLKYQKPKADPNESRVTKYI